MTGEILLDEPEPPEGDGTILWHWFFELNEGRQSSGFGPLPLSYVEIKSWCVLCGTRPQAWQIKVLRAMDAAFIGALVKAEKKNNG